MSGQFCLSVRSDLRLFVDVADFAAILRETNLFGCRSENKETRSAAQRTRLAQLDSREGERSVS